MTFRLPRRGARPVSQCQVRLELRVDRTGRPRGRLLASAAALRVARLGLEVSWTGDSASASWPVLRVRGEALPPPARLRVVLFGGDSSTGDSLGSCLSVLRFALRGGFRLGDPRGWRSGGGGPTGGGGLLPEDPMPGQHNLGCRTLSRGSLRISLESCNLCPYSEVSPGLIRLGPR